MTGAPDHPLVSIVIPVYNGANFLAEAIDSALGQTYPNIEVLVVDDGSDDGGATAAVAARYASRIRYIHQPNGGVAAALNRGIECMRGEFFSWLSHDDAYVADKVERQVEAYLGFGQRAIVIGDYELVAEDGETWRGTTKRHNLTARPLDAVFKGLINGCALLVPRILFDEIGTFDPGLPTTQDYFLWYRMARKVPFVQCLHVGVRQRQHPGQGSRQSNHLDEAGRMFIHLIEETPPEVMGAYSGSEAGFLLDIRPHMSVYPAALAYLDRRLRELRGADVGNGSGVSNGSKGHPAPAAPSSDGLAAALDGGPGVDYGAGIDHTDFLAAITGGFLPDRPVLLLLMHRIGGGSQTHVSQFAGAVSKYANVLFAYGDERSLTLSRSAASPQGGVRFHWEAAYDDLAWLLRLAGLARVDVHSVYQFQDQAARLLEALDVPHDLTVLDYDLFAHHPHLAGDDGRFVGDEALRIGSRCLLRAEPHPIARNASRLITLSRDTAARLGSIAAGVPIVCPARWDRPATMVRRVFVPRIRNGEPLRVIVPGRIDRRKGSDAVVGAARLALRRKLPLRFEILGSLVVDDAVIAEAGPALRVLGHYDRGSFAARLSAAAPHVAWIPTQVPETWSYVLSELFSVAMPVAATSIGALRERCHGRSFTWLLPYDASAETWVDFFLALRASELSLAPMWPDADDLPPARPFYFAEYLEPAREHR